MPWPQCSLRLPTTSSRPQHASVSPVERPAELDNQAVAAMGRAKSGKALKIRKYPTFERLEDERLYRKQHLAAAYRVFADRGFDEGVAGHISVRDPILPDHFCMYVLRPLPRKVGVAAGETNGSQGSIPSARTSRRYASRT